jgi:hypothetical protein
MKFPFLKGESSSTCETAAFYSVAIIMHCMMQSRPAEQFFLSVICESCRSGFVSCICFNADPDPAFFLSADPDPESQINTDTESDPDQTLP